jgi:hypothetical protein
LADTQVIIDGNSITADTLNLSSTIAQTQMSAVPSNITSKGQHFVDTNGNLQYMFDSVQYPVVGPDVNVFQPVKVSFSTQIDKRPVYTDEHISVGWDAPGADVEVSRKSTSPFASVLYTYAERQDQAQENLISVADYAYDVMSTGIPGGECARIWVSSTSNSSHPSYRLTVFVTDLSDLTNCIIERFN